MWFGVISLFPEMFDAFTRLGVIGRAFQAGQAHIHFINPRDYGVGNYQRVDERPFGGGPGMVMMAEPLAKAIQHAKDLASSQGFDDVPVIYLSPQGRLFHETATSHFMQRQGAIFLCGRYEGVDERLITRYVDEEWSIGDYVLSGGELAAMVIMDSLIRRVPQVLGDALSAEQDSFVDGLLDCPHYTKPDVFEGLAVPEVLKSGHHQDIEGWRFAQRFKRTLQRKPALVKDMALSKQQQKWLQQFPDDMDKTPK